MILPLLVLTDHRPWQASRLRAVQSSKVSNFDMKMSRRHAWKVMLECFIYGRISGVRTQCEPIWRPAIWYITTTPAMASPSISRMWSLGLGASSVGSILCWVITLILYLSLRRFSIPKMHGQEIIQTALWLVQRFQYQSETSLVFCQDS